MVVVVLARILASKHEGATALVGAKIDTRNSEVTNRCASGQDEASFRNHHGPAALVALARDRSRGFLDHGLRELSEVVGRSPGYVTVPILGFPALRSRAIRYSKDPLHRFRVPAIRNLTQPLDTRIPVLRVRSKPPRSRLPDLFHRFSHLAPFHRGPPSRSRARPRASAARTARHR